MQHLSHEVEQVKRLRVDMLALCSTHFQADSSFEKQLNGACITACSGLQAEMQPSMRAMIARDLNIDVIWCSAVGLQPPAVCVRYENRKLTATMHRRLSCKLKLGPPAQHRADCPPIGQPTANTLQLLSAAKIKAKHCKGCMQHEVSSPLQYLLHRLYAAQAARWAPGSGLPALQPALAPPPAAPLQPLQHTTIHSLTFRAAMQ